MKCPKCGNENKEGAKFCRKCGAKLEAVKPEEEKQKEPVKEKVEEAPKVVNQEKNKETNVDNKAKESKEEKRQEVKETKAEQKKVETKQAETKEPKKGGKKIFKKIVILLIIVALAVGGYFVYDKFFYKYEEKAGENLEKYFEESDQKYFDKINDIVLKYSNDAEATNKIKDVTKQKVEKAIENVNNATYNTSEEVETAFSDLENKINQIQTINVISEEEKDTYLEKISDIKDSKINYIDGLSKYNDKNYDKAYKSFVKVIEEDSLYTSAQEYIDKCMGDTISTIEEEYKKLTDVAEDASSSDIKTKYAEAYEYLINQNTKSSIDLNDSESYQKLVTESMTKIIESSVNIITENVNNKKYDEVESNVKELVGYIADISSDKEYKELIETSVQTITDLTTKSADALIAEYKYDDAKSLVQNVKEELSSIKSATSYVETLETKITEIEEKMPESLLKLSTRSRDYSISLKQSSFEDADGNKYETGIMAYCSSESSYTCTYNLKGTYKKLTATYGVCSANASNDATAYIKIYGDDKLLYTSDGIRWDSLPKTLDVDLSGVQMLKIEFVSADLDRNVFIGNPELYK